MVFPYSRGKGLSLHLHNISGVPIDSHGKTQRKKSSLKSGAPNTTGAEVDESAKAQVAIPEGWPHPVLCLLHSSLAGSMDQSSVCVPCLEQIKKFHQIPAFSLPHEMCQCF